MLPINKILAVPLNLPKFEPDSWATFWQVWQTDAKRYMRNRADSAGNNNPEPGWHGFCWEFDQPDGNGGTLGHQGMYSIPTKNYSDQFPLLRKQLDDAFPFRIQRIFFQSNYKEIPAHTDGLKLTDHLDYACAVRIIISDTNTRPNFYYSFEKPAEKRIYLDLPGDTNSFVYHNPKMYHGAEYHNRFKIVAHIVNDRIDEDRWFQILRRSVEAYPTKALLAP